MARTRYTNFAVDSEGNVLPNTDVSVRDPAGNLVTVYSDAAGASLANPFTSDALDADEPGRLAFFADVPFAGTVQTGAGASEADIDVLISDAAFCRNTVSDLLNDTLFVYAGGTGTEVNAGDRLRVLNTGYTYEVAAEGATDHHLTTAGDVKLYILGRVFHAEAFGIVPSATADQTTEWNALWDAVTAAVDTTDLGGPPVVVLPKGIIRFSSTVTLPENAVILGSGAGKQQSGDHGTILETLSTQTIFYTGAPLNDPNNGNCRSVTIKDMTLQRAADQDEIEAETGLLHGHQAIEWHVENVRFKGGYTPCINFTNAFDCKYYLCQFESGGVPDGTPAVNILKDPDQETSNYQMFFQCRWERTSGPMGKLEGQSHSLIQCKMHATSNNAGSTALPAFVFSDSTTVTGCGFNNHETAEAATKCSVWIELADGECSITANVFRNNDTIPLIRITGAAIFARRHVIANNTFDQHLTPAIVDARTAGGPIQLGPVERALYGEEGGSAGDVPSGVTEPNVGDFYGRYSKATAGGFPPLKASYDNGSGSGDGDLAAHFVSGNFARPVVIVEQTRSSGSTEPNISILTGLPDTNGRDALRVTAGVGDTDTITAQIKNNGEFHINQTKVLGEQQSAIASLTDSTGGSGDGTLAAISGSGADSDINNNFADVNDKLDAILAALRAHGLIAT